MKIAIAKEAAVSGVGGFAEQVACSVRAGIIRLGESSLVSASGLPFILAWVPDHVLPLQDEILPGNRHRRILSMMSALADELRGKGAAVPYGRCIVCCPPHPNPKAHQFFTERVGAILGIHPTRIQFIEGRQTSGMRAIQMAAKLIAEGESDILVVAADSCLHASLLHHEDRIAALRTSESGGRVLGEGAVALHLVAAGEGGSVVGAVVKEAFDPARQGDARPLSVCFSKLAKAGVAGPSETVISTSCGSADETKEWGIASVRHSSSFAADSVPVYPAMHYGDLGHAAGLMAVAIASASWRRGWMTGLATVIALEDSARAVVQLDLRAIP